MYLIVGTNSKSLFRILFYNSFKVKKESDSVYISLTQQVNTHTQVNCFVVVFFVSADQALSLIES